MKIYLIGPSLPDPMKSLELFTKAQYELEEAGHTVQNITHHAGLNELPMQRAISYRLQTMLRCEAVCVLPGWQQDSISELEVATAARAIMLINVVNDTVMPSSLTFYLPHSKILNKDV